MDIYRFSVFIIQGVTETTITIMAILYVFAFIMRFLIRAGQYFRERTTISTFFCSFVPVKGIRFRNSDMICTIVYLLSLFSICVLMLTILIATKYHIVNHLIYRTYRINIYTRYWKKLLVEFSVAFQVSNVCGGAENLPTAPVYFSNRQLEELKGIFIFSFCSFLMLGSPSKLSENYGNHGN